jgi:hypothetical protein
MTYTLPVPLAHLERRLGVDEGALEGPDKARAEDALEDATALALAEVSAATADRWKADLPAVVRTVLLKAARREYENPQGYRSENLGEFGGTVDVVGVYLTAPEKEQIRRAGRRSGRTGGFVGTIRTPSAYAEEPGR